jgi:predicted lipid-binding transport protein (Tim44 family)
MVEQMFDLGTLIPLIIAVVVIFKLRSVLGQRSDDDRPPHDPYRSEENSRHIDNDDGPSANDNVVTLPHRSSKGGAADEIERPKNPAIGEIDKIANKRTKLNKTLKGILERDSSFSPGSFVSGAKLAYEMIVNAFADGDKKTLKSLLSREVYEGFADAIDVREKNGEKIQSSFVGIEQAGITAADLQKDETQITVRFTSQIISATFDKKDKIIDGDLQEVVEVTDVWTFARSLKSRDPNWKLVATEADD